MSKEIWKDIEEYNGVYQVSSFGRIKSLSRSIIRSNGAKQTFKERILSPTKASSGYNTVKLAKVGVVKTNSVHVLVAIHFLNHKPNGYNTVIDHINNIETDNRVENLQLISHRANISKGKKGKTSDFTGVSKRKKSDKWRAMIQIKGKDIHLGMFNTEIEAHNAYQNKLKTL